MQTREELQADNNVTAATVKARAQNITQTCNMSQKLYETSELLQRFSGEMRKRPHSRIET